MRDHLLNWQLPAQPLGPAIRKQTEPARWPFPLAPKAPTFVADCRTMDSDRPKQTHFHEIAEPAANIAPGCFGVWRKTCPPLGVELLFRAPWSEEIKTTYRGGPWEDGDGWEWFDTSAGQEKPAQAEPQADAKGWVAWSGGECPVSPGACVALKFRSGREAGGSAVFYRWFHDGSGGDVVAYRRVFE